MDNLKIAFVKAKNEIDVHWFRPLTYGYLSAAAQRRFGSRCEIVPMDGIENLDGYHALAISATSQDFGSAVLMARDARSRYPGILILIGGNHITLLPGTFNDAFDIGVLGEGEDTFCDLAALLLESGPSPDPARLKNIPGLLYHDNGAVVTTAPRVLIEPLDNLAHPLRMRDETQYLFTSRGCPYKCAFCSSCVFWGKTRFFSAEYVVEEIRQILASNPETRFFPIMDDLFIVNRKRLERIIELLEEKPLPPDIRFSFSVRANLITDEMCALLKRLPVDIVSFGIESGSNRMLKILEKNATVEQNQNALDLLHKHGLNPVCSFIVGIPSETEQEVLATYEFLTSNIRAGKLSFESVVNILMPLPGTRMWDHAVAHGIIQPGNFDWMRLAVFASYRHSNAASFEDWVAIRKANQSVYMNEPDLPVERLYRIMAEQEAVIQQLEQQRKRFRKSIRFKMGRYIRRNILKTSRD